MALTSSPLECDLLNEPGSAVEDLLENIDSISTFNIQADTVLPWIITVKIKETTATMAAAAAKRIVFTGGSGKAGRTLYSLPGV